MTKVWFNGKLIDEKKARIGLSTHALHYGTSVFEGIRFYDAGNKAAIFRLREHVRRFFYSARALKMKLPWTAAQLEQAIVQTVRTSGHRSGYIRPIAFYGESALAMNPKKVPVNVAVLALPWGKYTGQGSLTLVVPNLRRIGSRTTDHRAKIGGPYVTLIMAHWQAIAKGGDQALVLDEKGNVAEAAGANFFTVKNGKLYTPKEGSILPGITRDSIMRIAKDMGIAAIEKNLRLPDVYRADECFLTGTAVEIMPVVKLNGKKLGSSAAGPLTVQLANIFSNIVSGKAKKYRKWLTLV